MNKRIIELPDEVVKAIQNGEDYRYDVHTAIAQSKPYDDSGDLISREALIKAFENLASDDYNEPIWYQKTVFETIDNAPTVPQVTVFAENADETAVADLKAELQSVIEPRPQGEWATDERGYFYCDKCKQHPYNQYAMTNYCPNCGADMRMEDK